MRYKSNTEFGTAPPTKVVTLWATSHRETVFHQVLAWLSGLTGALLPPRVSSANAALGKMLVATRKSRGLSQESVAQGLGVSISRIRRIENGADGITPSELANFSRLSGVRVSTLMTCDATRLSGPPRRSKSEIAASLREAAVPEPLVQLMLKNP